MNSEIPNVLKLSSVTVLDAANKNTEGRNSLVTVASQSNLQVPSVGQSEGKIADAQMGMSSSSPEALKTAIDKGNSLLQEARRNLQFKVDDATKEVVVQIVDNDSGEVVRQIPAEETLEYIRRMHELEGHKGSVLQERA